MSMNDTMNSKCFNLALNEPNIDLIITLNHIDPQSQYELLELQINHII